MPRNYTEALRKNHTACHTPRENLRQPNTRIAAIISKFFLSMKAVDSPQKDNQQNARPNDLDKLMKPNLHPRYYCGCGHNGTHCDCEVLQEHSLGHVA
jgi:hypothetical protein